MVEILSIDDIRIASINNKYMNKSFRLTKTYKKFKRDILLCTKNVVIFPPQRVHIIVSTYLDIDNFLKPLLDCFDKSFINDRNILELYVKKTPIKRGALGSIRVYAESINEEQ